MAGLSAFRPRKPASLLGPLPPSPGLSPQKSASLRDALIQTTGNVGRVQPRLLSAIDAENRAAGRAKSEAMTTALTTNPDGRYFQGAQIQPIAGRNQFVAPPLAQPTQDATLQSLVKAKAFGKANDNRLDVTAGTDSVRIAPNESTRQDMLTRGLIPSVQANDNLIQGNRAQYQAMRGKKVADRQALVQQRGIERGQIRSGMETPATLLAQRQAGIGREHELAKGRLANEGNLAIAQEEAKAAGAKNSLAGLVGLVQGGVPLDQAQQVVGGQGGATLPRGPLAQTNRPLTEEENATLASIKGDPSEVSKELDKRNLSPAAKQREFERIYGRPLPNSVADWNAGDWAKGVPNAIGEGMIAGANALTSPFANLLAPPVVKAVTPPQATLVPQATDNAAQQRARAKLRQRSTKQPTTSAAQQRAAQRHGAWTQAFGG